MKILFVCLGNICRSPMADAVMLNLLNENNLTGKIIIDSAGTEYYHIGKPADERAIRTCLKYNIDLKYHRARQINQNDFDEYDIIYTMATDVHAEVLSLTKNKTHHKKVIQFMVVLQPNKNLSVPDPWYGSEAEFEPVFALIKTGCKKIVAKLIADQPLK